jgi:hypothetical protein
MPPVLVTPPDGTLVPVETCRDYCFLRGENYSTTLVAAARDAAEAYLDGYAGVLGRSLQLTTWREDFAAWGTLRLSMPDVLADSVNVTALDEDGIAVPGTVELDVRQDAQGWYVEASGPAAVRVQVEYQCRAPEAVRKVAIVVVLMLVKHWYHRRDIVLEGAAVEIPFAASSLIATIRRGQIA